jgi:hypothetical protein
MDSATHKFGVTDIRISDNAIPWKAVKNVKDYASGYNRPRVVHLDLIPDENRNLKFKGYWGDNLKYFHYVDITSQLLTVRAGTLFSVIREGFDKSRVVS